MSTLINLLPDLRQAKLRDLRRRQLAIGLGFSVTVLCGATVGILVLYMLAQKAVMSVRSNEITSEMNKLKSVDGLVEAMTANEHLASLPSLYEKRVLLSKFFKAYSEANPVGIILDTLSVDLSLEGQKILKVSGNGPSYAEIAKLARALEASNVVVGEGASVKNEPYFSNVAIAGVTKTDNGVASFSLSAIVSSAVVSEVTPGVNQNAVE